MRMLIHIWEAREVYLGGGPIVVQKEHNVAKAKPIIGKMLDIDCVRGIEEP